jgi:hypothetical protein
VLRLTLLAPDIVEAILEGRQPESLTLDVLLKPFPVAWAGQGTLARAMKASASEAKASER